MTNIRTPEDVAAETVLECAKHLDFLSGGVMPDTAKYFRAAARTLRDNRTSIILAVTKPMEG